MARRRNWDPSDHPRDGEGKFTDKPFSLMTPSERKGYRRDLMSQLDSAGATQPAQSLWNTGKLEEAVRQVATRKGFSPRIAPQDSTPAAPRISAPDAPNAPDAPARPKPVSKMTNPEKKAYRKGLMEEINAAGMGQPTQSLWPTDRLERVASDARKAAAGQKPTRRLSSMTPSEKKAYRKELMAEIRANGAGDPNMSLWNTEKLRDHAKASRKKAAEKPAETSAMAELTADLERLGADKQTMDRVRGVAKTLANGDRTNREGSQALERFGDSLDRDQRAAVQRAAEKLRATPDAPGREGPKLQPYIPGDTPKDRGVTKHGVGDRVTWNAGDIEYSGTIERTGMNLYGGQPNYSHYVRVESVKSRSGRELSEQFRSRAVGGLDNQMDGTLRPAPERSGGSGGTDAPTRPSEAVPGQREAPETPTPQQNAPRIASATLGGNSPRELWVEDRGRSGHAVMQQRPGKDPELLTVASTRGDALQRYERYKRNGSVDSPVVRETPASATGWKKGDGAAAALTAAATLKRFDNDNRNRRFLEDLGKKVDRGDMTPDEAADELEQHAKYGVSNVSTGMALKGLAATVRMEGKDRKAPLDAPNIESGPTHPQLWHVTSSQGAADAIAAGGFQIPEKTENGNYFGKGVYLFTDKGDADEFLAGQLAYMSNDAVMFEAHATVQNPFRVHAEVGNGTEDDPFGAFVDAVRAAGINPGPIGQGTKARNSWIEAATKLLQDRGYDGVEVTLPDGIRNGGIGGRQLLVFDASKAVPGAPKLTSATIEKAATPGTDVSPEWRAAERAVEQETAGRADTLPIPNAGTMKARRETYKGRKLEISKDPRREGAWYVRVNGEVAHSFNTYDSKKLDSEVVQTRRLVDAADARKAGGEPDAYPAHFYQGAPEVLPAHLAGKKLTPKQRQELNVDGAQSGRAGFLQRPGTINLQDRLGRFNGDEQDRIQEAATDLYVNRGETPNRAWTLAVEGMEDRRLAGLPAVDPAAGRPMDGPQWSGTVAQRLTRGESDGNLDGPGAAGLPATTGAATMDTSGIDVDQLTSAQLRAEAARLSVSGRASMSTATLRDAVRKERENWARLDEARGIPATPVAAGLPGKAVGLRLPDGLKARDIGEKTYDGKPILTVYGPDGEPVLKLIKDTRENQKLSGSIKIGTTIDKGFRTAPPGATLVGSSSARFHKGSAHDAVEYHMRNIKPHLDKIRGMSDAELDTRREEAARMGNRTWTGWIDTEKRRRKEAGGGQTEAQAIGDLVAATGRPVTIPAPGTGNPIRTDDARTLMRKAGNHDPDTDGFAGHAARIGPDDWKSLSQDERDKIRGMLETRANMQFGSKQTKQQAGVALQHLNEVEGRTERSAPGHKPFAIQTEETLGSGNQEGEALRSQNLLVMTEQELDAHIAEMERVFPNTTGQTEARLRGRLVEAKSTRNAMARTREQRANEVSANAAPAPVAAPSAPDVSKMTPAEKKRYRKQLMDEIEQGGLGSPSMALWNTGKLEQTAARTRGGAPSAPGDRIATATPEMAKPEVPSAPPGVSKMTPAEKKRYRVGIIDELVAAWDGEPNRPDRYMLGLWNTKKLEETVGRVRARSSTPSAPGDRIATATPEMAKPEVPKPAARAKTVGVGLADVKFGRDEATGQILGRKNAHGGQNLSIQVGDKHAGMLITHRDGFHEVEIGNQRIQLDGRGMSQAEVGRAARRIILGHKQAASVRSQLARKHITAKRTTTSVPGWYNHKAGFEVSAGQDGTVTVRHSLGDAELKRGRDQDKVDAHKTAKAAKIREYDEMLRGLGYNTRVDIDDEGRPVVVHVLPSDTPPVQAPARVNPPGVVDSEDGPVAQIPAGPVRVGTIVNDTSVGAAMVTGFSLVDGKTMVDVNTPGGARQVPLERIDAIFRLAPVDLGKAPTPDAPGVDTPGAAPAAGGFTEDAVHAWLGAKATMYERDIVREFGVSELEAGEMMVALLRRPDVIELKGGVYRTGAPTPDAAPASDTIRTFQGRNAFLSNFHVEPDGLTLEHRFQAAKTVNTTPRMFPGYPQPMTEREWVLAAPKPGQAKARGKKVTLRPNWNEERVEVMRGLLHEKYQDPDLRARLDATGDAVLEEGNIWNDTFWGVSLKTGKGKNNLGKLLMELREENRTARGTAPAPFTHPLMDDPRYIHALPDAEQNWRDDHGGRYPQTVADHNEIKTAAVSAIEDGMYADQVPADAPHGLSMEVSDVLREAAFARDELLPADTDQATRKLLTDRGFVDGEGRITEDGAIAYQESERFYNYRNIEGVEKYDVVTHDQHGRGVVHVVSLGSGDIQVKFRDGGLVWIPGRELHSVEKRRDMGKPVEQLRREGWASKVADRLPGQRSAPLAGDKALDTVPKGLFKPGTLTPEQRKNLEFYETSMFREINGGLRGGKPNGMVERTAASIDSAMDGSVLPQEIETWRGMYTARDLFKDSLDGDLTGFTWKELGYSSTTASEDKAHDYMVLSRERYKGQNVKIRVRVPAGMKAVQVSTSTEGSRYNGPQAEVLLQRDITWRIVEDHGVHPDGYRVLTAEVSNGNERGSGSGEASRGLRGPGDREAGQEAGPEVEERTWADRAAAARRGSEALNSTPLSYDRLRSQQGGSVGGQPVEAVVSSIDAYRGGGHRAINDHLREAGGDPAEIAKPTRMAAGRQVDFGEYVERIDAAHADSRLPQDVELWRGFSQPHLTFGDAWNEKDVTGLEWVDHGYTSTTTDEDAARKFAGALHRDMPRGAENRVMLRLIAPKGTGAVQLSGEKLESELLLSRGLRFRVVKDNGTRDGARYLDVEVVVP